MDWREFEATAPKLARLGRDRFETTHVALLGSLRKDGSPRISPIEPYLVAGHLLLGMLTASRKALDLRREPRCVVHSSVSDVNGSEGEFKIDGRAVLVTDNGLLGAEPRAWWNAPDASDASVFSIDIQSAAHVSWDIKHGNMTVVRWTPADGTKKLVTTY